MIYIYMCVCVCAFLMCVSGDHHNKNGFVTSKIWYIHINDRETLSWGTCMNFICTPWPSVINACKCNMIFWFFLTYYFQAIPSHLQMWLWLDKLCYLFFFRKGDFKRIPPPPPPHTHTHTHTIYFLHSWLFNTPIILLPGENKCLVPAIPSQVCRICTIYSLTRAHSWFQNIFKVGNKRPPEWN